MPRPRRASRSRTPSWRRPRRSAAVGLAARGAIGAFHGAPRGGMRARKGAALGPQGFCGRGCCARRSTARIRVAECSCAGGVLGRSPRGAFALRFCGLRRPAPHRERAPRPFRSAAVEAEPGAPACPSKIGTAAGPATGRASPRALRARRSAIERLDHAADAQGVGMLLPENGAADIEASAERL